MTIPVTVFMHRCALVALYVLLLVCPAAALAPTRMAHELKGRRTCSGQASKLLAECWAGLPAVAARLLQFLSARDALRLTSVCRALNSTLRCTSVPSVHLFLLMRQAVAGPGQALEEMPVPWGRCYTPDGGRVYLLAPAGLRVPFRWAGPSDDCPALVGNRPPCTVASPWCAVVEGAACLLMDLPDPVEAAAAVLESRRRYGHAPLLLVAPVSLQYSLFYPALRLLVSVSIWIGEPCLSKIYTSVGLRAL